MKLKAFDITDILYKNSKVYDLVEEIKEKLKSYVIYFKKNDSIGICFEEQKNIIVKILSEYGETNTIGNFINTDTFFINGGYDWDYIYLGDIQIEGDIAWEEFNKLLKKYEQLLIDAGDNFEEAWYRLQRIALRKVLDNELDRLQKQLNKTIRDANADYEKYIGLYELNPNQN